MKVGTIVKLKRVCLGNPIGTVGVVFYDYGDGSQAIFENGNYDGFNERDTDYGVTKQTEKDFILEEIGFAEYLAYYQFKNVMQVSQDYRKGIFDAALQNPKAKEVEP